MTANHICMGSVSQDDPDFAKIDTTILDSRGLPHTLEHLIFTGSRHYPARGYLDKLATVCLSTGTNAYTCEDHTCYFVTTASFEGLLKLVPVYLDHILYPRLSPEDMALEVFSLEGSPKEARGVVYCEMKSRENTEADQMDIRLRNHVFAQASKDDKHLETYRWECGGASQRVSHLTPEEIRAYHCKFYQPGRITVFVSGMLSDGEKANVLDTLKAFDYVESQPVVCDRIEEALAEAVPPKEGHFPADDESIGSVGFGWLGPAIADLDTIMALHILLRALRDTSASPLYQEFVECVDPCASDIDYDVRGFKRAMLSLIFSGVPTADNDDDEEDGDDEEDTEKIRAGYIKERMFVVFNDLLADEDKLFKCIQSALKSFTLKLKEQYEEDPHELALGYCLSEILTNGAVGHGITQLPALLKDLGTRPVRFWADLFKAYLLHNECHEVIMKPSKTLSETIKQAELDNIKVVEELDQYPKEGAALVESFAEEMPAVPLPKTFLKATQQFSSSDRLSVQVVQLEASSFTTVSVGFRIEGVVEAHLWPLLVVFQELIFQCDLDASSARSSILKSHPYYTYQDVQRLMSSTFTTYEAAVGMGNELFSVSYLDTHFVVTLTFPSSTVDVLACVDLVLDVIRHSRFTEERIQVTVDNLVSQLSDAKRDPSNVIDACFYEHLHGTTGVEPSQKRTKCSDPVFLAISMFRQEQVLAGLKECINEETVNSLNALRDAILTSNPFDGLGSFVHVGVGAPDDSLPQKIHALWNSSIDSDAFPVPEQLPRYGDRTATGTILIPMADITASFFGCSVFVPVLPSGGVLDEQQLRLYLSLAILCHMLSFTEGPLYNRIRGKGLAYGANLSLSLWNGLLSFDLNDSTAPVEAFETFLGLVRDVLEECCPNGGGVLLCDTTLMAAKASFAYTNVSDRSTPSSVYSLALRSAVRGGYPIIDGDRHAKFMGLLEAITIGDIASAVRPHLEKFLETSSRLLVGAVPASELDAIAGKLETLGLAPSVRRVTV